VLSVCVLSAQENVQNILPLQANEFSSLMSGEVLSQDNEGGTDVTKFVPKGSLLAKKLASAPSGAQGFAVTSVSVVPYPSSWGTMTPENRLLALYNVLGRISTQKGITYISRRAGYKPKVLFDQSYFISSPDKVKTAIADPVAARLPAAEKRWVYQNDTSFGATVYEYTYTTDGDEIFVEITNLTPMKYHGITCLKEKEMSMYISILPADDGVILNSAAVVRGHKTHVQVLFMDVDLSDSFRRRTESLHTWYRDQLSK